ncbi:MAG: T9SS type A sorting domain-containing protein [Flavobacteriales bacterium]|nr:T9SS type A sorting domain-containing protein [Flavobacteriales bacterium]
MKLKNYGLVAAAVAAAGSVQATIVHTDVNPDVVLSTDGDNFRIDLNDDGTDDFNISFEFLSNKYNDVGFQNQNSANYYAFKTGPDYSGKTKEWVSAISYGDPIDSTAIYNWGTEPYTGLNDNVGWEQVVGNAFPNPYGLFNDKTAYIGVKFLVDGQNHFGWIQVTMSDEYATTTIHDFAYESCYDVSIIAGQTTGGCDPVSVAENADFKVSIYPNPVQDQLHLIFPASMNNGTVRLLDITGKVIETQSNLKGNKQQISMEQLPVGVYILESTVAGNTVRKKVVKS